MRIQAVAALAAMAMALTACATREDVATIPYKVHGGPMTGAGHAVALTVNDARTQDRGKIANKTNAYGMEMAAIRADREVTAIVKDALEAELKSRGFAIGNDGASATVAINRFYATFQSHVFSAEAVGDVKFHVAVTSPAGAPVYDREVDASGVEPGILLANGSNAAAALSDGLGKAFDTLFSDPAFLAALETGAGESSSNVKAGS
jgi:uncharacterized lipoprotein YajG